MCINFELNVIGIIIRLRTFAKIKSQYFYYYWLKENNCTRGIAVFRWN